MLNNKETLQLSFSETIHTINFLATKKFTSKNSQLKMSIVQMLKIEVQSGLRKDRPTTSETAFLGPFDKYLDFGGY